MRRIWWLSIVGFHDQAFSAHAFLARARGAGDDAADP
jgi:hypothetical protein